MPRNPFFYLIPGFIALVVLANTLFVVRETEQAMVLTFGKLDRVVAEPGLKARLPFIQQVLYFDKRLLETDSSAEEVQTLDKKRVVVDSFTRWRIVDPEKFYQAVRTEQAALSRIELIVNSNIRQVVARAPLDVLVSDERTALLNQVQAASSREAAPLGIEIVDVRIKRADLPASNSRAVFSRMQAEREKEAKDIRARGAEEAQKIRADAEKQRTILLAEAEREAQTLRGQGDADAIRITAEAYAKDPQFFKLVRSLEVYRNGLSGEKAFLVLDPDLAVFDELEGPR